MSPKKISSKGRGRFAPQRLALATAEALATGADIDAIARTYGLTARTLSGYCTRMQQVIGWILGGTKAEGAAGAVQKMAEDLAEAQQRLAILRGVESARVLGFDILPHTVRQFAQPMCPIPISFALVKDETDPEHLGHPRQVGPPSVIPLPAHPAAAPPRKSRGPKPKVEEGELIQAISDLNLDLRGRYPGTKAIRAKLRENSIIASIPRIQAAMQKVRSRQSPQKPSRRKPSK